MDYCTVLARVRGSRRGDTHDATAKEDKKKPQKKPILEDSKSKAQEGWSECARSEKD